jgi:hypothetical protein
VLEAESRFKQRREQRGAGGERKETAEKAV